MGKKDDITNKIAVIDGVLMCYVLCRTKEGAQAEELALTNREEIEEYIWLDYAIDLTDVTVVKSTGPSDVPARDNKAQFSRTCGDMVITNLDFMTGVNIWLEFRMGGDLTSEEETTGE